jgi:hypothetical protein
MGLASSLLGTVERMNPTNYEVPQIERLGTVADLTEGGHLADSDTGNLANNAFSNP